VNNQGKTSRVPVKIFNLSAKAVSLPSKANLCQLHEVTVIRKAPIFKENNGTHVTLNIQTTGDNKEDQEDEQEFTITLDNTNLNEEQKKQVNQVFAKWKHIFSKGPTDLRNTDLRND
jgi:hypothetical protein